MKDITVSILCGGKSSRMKSEKGLVLYQRKPFIEHIIQAVLPITNKIQLITNSEDYDYLAHKKVKDKVSDKGPIGGIYSALLSSETHLNLILSCDIPLITTEVILELIQNKNKNSAISVCRTANRTHPLIGIYSKNILPQLLASIETNNLKMMDLLSKTKHQCIESNHAHTCFKNINTIAELEELQNHLS
jgi:molybdenum cofactor guanylyltransferase